MTPPIEAQRRLSTATVVWFALPQLAQGFALLPVVNYVPGFYSDHLGLPLTIVGLMLVLSRVTDIVIDPVVGAWSDRSRSRFGRRKPFIAVGVPIMMVSAWYVFVPPAGAGAAWLFWGLFFLYLGFTLVTIPYASWGAELSSDYDERSRLAAVRGAFGSAGSLLTLSIPVILQMLGYRDTALFMMVMAVCFIVLQPLTFAATMTRIPDRGGVAVAADVPRGKLSALLVNAPLRRLMGAIALLIVGMAVGATLNMIFFKHVAHQADYFANAVFVQNVVAIAFLPLWLKVAARLGKHRAMAIAMLSIGACSAATFMVGPGDGLLLSGLVVGIGAGMGAIIFLSSSMVADLVDRDMLETGEERTGLYMAAAGVATKVAGVFGVLVGTAVPGLAGFQPSDAVHSAQSLLVLRIVYAFVCPLLAVPAALILWNYPLDRGAQQALRVRIDERRRADT